MVSAQNHAAAVKDSESRKLPMVIAFGVSDGMVTNDLRALTGANGKAVLLMVPKRHPDRPLVQRRYNQVAYGFILVDPSGNLLKNNMGSSADVVEAIDMLDELSAQLHQQWKAAIKQGKVLIDGKKFPEAAAALQIFAFASGSETATEGKKLYDQVAVQANQAYAELTKSMPAGKLTDSARKEWAEKLTNFVEQWPRTPAAFTAEDRIEQLLALAIALPACEVIKPMFQPASSLDEQACVACHETHVQQWSNGEHRRISCERCHGPGALHATATASPRPKMPPTNGAQACLVCHGKLGSFEEHVKALEAKHVMKVCADRAQGKCVYCHDPHSLQ